MSQRVQKKKNNVSANTEREKKPLCEAKFFQRRVEKEHRKMGQKPSKGKKKRRGKTTVDLDIMATSTARETIATLGEMVRGAYLELAAKEPKRIEVFNAAQSIEKLAGDIRQACLSRFDWLPDEP